MKTYIAAAMLMCLSLTDAQEANQEENEIQRTAAENTFRKLMGVRGLWSGFNKGLYKRKATPMEADCLNDQTI